MTKRINVRSHKFNAKATMVDGIRFASQKEARRYQELKLLEKAGAIRNIRVQPRFELTVENNGYPDNGGGRSMVIGHYVADFAYTMVIGHYVSDFAYTAVGYRPVLDQEAVEDVKGFKTPLYRWKKKHVEAQYGIQVREL